MRVRGFRLAGAMLLTLLAAAAQAGSDEARGWIHRMNDALISRNYDGVFKQRFGERSEVMRIIHRVKDGEMTERVISTDGSGYEQKRKDEKWAQFFPDKRRVEVASRHRSFGYIPALNGIDSASAAHYDIKSGGLTRILGGVEVQVIEVLPKDALRYGYRFWLDRTSALPLRFQRVTHDGTVLKEIAFISPPQMPEQISDEQLKVELDTKGFTFVDRDQRAPMRNAQIKKAYRPQRALLPAGYRSLTFSTPVQEASAPGQRARFVVSDGVSFAEVFLAPATGEAKPAGGFAMGPLFGYSLRLDDVQVTVVGEMPEGAARAIAEAVRPE